MKSGRGKKKMSWSKEERKVLWECYLRSGGRRSKGYMKRLQEIWDGRDISVRKLPSLISQIKCIESNNLLTVVERGEIERLLREGHGGEKFNEEERGNDDVVQAEKITRSNKEWENLSEGSGEIGEREASEVVNEDHIDMVVEQSSIEEVKIVVDRLDVWKEAEEVRMLNEDEKMVIKMLREVFKGSEWVQIPSLKSHDRRSMMKEVKLVNGLIHNLVEDGMGVTEMNRLLYAGSYVVCNRLGLIRKKKGKSLKSKKPWWQRRLETSIDEWRKDLGRVEEIAKGTAVVRRIRERLERKYGLTEKGTLSVSALLKNKIHSGSTKIKWYVEANQRVRQNNLFKNNQNQLYKELGNGAGQSNNASPNAEEAKEFWSNIWAVNKEHDKKASWLNGVKKEMETVKKQEDIEIGEEDVKVGIRKMADWKAPGPDGVRGFWFKKFQTLHKALTSSLQECLKSGVVPEWMIKRRTVLIQKDPQKGTVPSNYRPIVCLPLMWKLLTGIFADKIYDHLLSNNLLPDEQKGCRKRSRGTKD